jgi:hypothetical protein
MPHRNYSCAAIIVVVAGILFQHTAAAQSDGATTRRQKLVAWCSGTEQFGLCESLVPEIEEAHRRQPFSPAELEQIELNVVRDIAKSDFLGERHRQLLDVTYTRSGFHLQLDEIVRATRSEDAPERYRAVLRLEYLSRSDLPPAAWQAAADVMRDPRNRDTITMTAAAMLAAHRQRGGPDITQAYFAAMREKPRYAGYLARQLSSFAPRDQIVRYGMDQTLPLEARRGVVSGGGMPRWSGDQIAAGLERVLWEIASSDPDYQIRQSASLALRQYQKPRPWRAILENKQMYRNLLNNTLLVLLFVPALIIFAGLFVARRWLLVLWIVLSLWLVVLYGFMFLVGLAHGKPHDFEQLFLAVGITAGIQVLLVVLAFRQRRARLRELDYDSPTATAPQRAADTAT